MIEPCKTPDFVITSLCFVREQHIMFTSLPITVINIKVKNLLLAVSEIVIFIIVERLLPNMLWLEKNQSCCECE